VSQGFFFGTPKCCNSLFDRFLICITGLMQFVYILDQWLVSSLYVNSGFICVLVEIDQACTW